MARFGRSHPSRVIYSRPVLGPVVNVLAADAGVYTITGQAAAVTATRLVSAVAGVYTITGSAVTFALTRLVAATAGVYVITGQAASLLASRLLSAVAGVYVITGQAATLAKLFVLNAAAGVYDITGSAASLLASRLISAVAGVYTITGSAANLVKAFIILAEAGVYTITGFAASLIPTFVERAFATGGWRRYRQWILKWPEAPAPGPEVLTFGETKATENVPHWTQVKPGRRRGLYVPRSFKRVEHPIQRVRKRPRRFTATRAEAERGVTADEVIRRWKRKEEETLVMALVELGEL